MAYAARRSSVRTRTNAARGLITYQRGLITVVDRKRLEAACCERYIRVRKDLERLLDGAARANVGKSR